MINPHKGDSVLNSFLVSVNSVNNLLIISLTGQNQKGDYDYSGWDKWEQYIHKEAQDKEHRNSIL